MPKFRNTIASIHENKVKTYFLLYSSIIKYSQSFLLESVLAEGFVWTDFKQTRDCFCFIRLEQENVRIRWSCQRRFHHGIFSIHCYSIPLSLNTLHFVWLHQNHQTKFMLMVNVGFVGYSNTFEFSSPKTLMSSKNAQKCLRFYKDNSNFQKTLLFLWYSCDHTLLTEGYVSVSAAVLSFEKNVFRNVYWPMAADDQHCCCPNCCFLPFVRIQKILAWFQHFAEIMQSLTHQQFMWNWLNYFEADKCGQPAKLLKTRSVASRNVDIQHCYQHSHVLFCCLFGW